ncbi:unnamed protein product [Arctogadus glacialis]
MSGGRARRSPRQEEAVREWDHGAGSIGFPLLLSFTANSYSGLQENDRGKGRRVEGRRVEEREKGDGLEKRDEEGQKRGEERDMTERVWR